MILALEGPDRSGKTSILNHLRQFMPVRIVDNLGIPEGCSHAAAELEKRRELLFRQMYDPATFYLLDRSFTVSAQVYSKLYNRPLLFDPAPWVKEQHIFYLDVPTDVLCARHAATGDPFDPARYDEVKSIYREVLLAYVCTPLDGEHSSDDLALAVFMAFRAMQSRIVRLGTQ